MKAEEQPIQTVEDYLFHTWIEGETVIKTEKGGITISELLIDFRSHILQNLEHNKEAYHQSRVNAENGNKNETIICDYCNGVCSDNQVTLCSDCQSENNF
tara:strand:+ start:685 stop:984 length:300 start_codon:yes stop_codon:yes gene_type:complete